MGSTETNIADAVAQLEQGRAELERALTGVPEDARGSRPAPDRWSAAEVPELGLDRMRRARQERTWR